MFNKSTSFPLYCNLVNRVEQLLSSESYPTDLSLVLPSHLFFATPVELPRIQKNQLQQTLQLQQSRLFPGINTPLQAQVKPSPSIDNSTTEHTLDEHHVLWFSAETANKIYKQGYKTGHKIKLIFPFSLLYLNKDEPIALLEHGDFFSTIIIWSGSEIVLWSSVAQADLKNYDFNKEWVSLLQSTKESYTIKEIEEPHSPTPLSCSNCATVESYGFIPPDYQEKRKHQKKRWMVLTISTTALTIFILSLYPIINQISRQEQLNQTYKELKNSSLKVQKIRENHYIFNKQYAPLLEIPTVKIKELIYSLDSIIPDNTHLTRFHYKHGSIELEGQGPSPDKLLEQLESFPEFPSAALTKATQQASRTQQDNRFGLRFGLIKNKIKPYMEKFLPSTPH